MSAGIGYSLGPLTPDQLDFVHALPRSVLLAAANNKVDLNRIAREELANRGYDVEGVWVGFVQADRLLRSHGHPPPSNDSQ